MSQQSHSKDTKSEPESPKPAWAAALSLGLLLLIAVASLSAVRGEESIVGEVESEAKQEASADRDQVDIAVVSSKRLCEELDVKVVRTGKFDGAKLRATPGFEYEQAGIVTRGAHLVVCETAETPGTKIPNVWYRIYEGKHKGLWIHKQVLDF